MSIEPPPENPYAAYARNQRQPPALLQPPPPGYLSNGYPVAPVFATGKAQGAAPRNTMKTVRIFVIFTAIGLFAFVGIPLIVVQILWRAS